MLHVALSKFSFTFHEKQTSDHAIPDLPDALYGLHGRDNSNAHVQQLPLFSTVIVYQLWLTIVTLYSSCDLWRCLPDLPILYKDQRTGSALARKSAAGKCTKFVFQETTGTVFWSLNVFSDHVNKTTIWKQLVSI